MSLALIAEQKKLHKNKSIVSTCMWILRIYVAAFATLIVVTTHSKEPQIVAKEIKALTKH